MVMENRVLSYISNHLKNNDYDNKNDHQRSKHLRRRQERRTTRQFQTGIGRRKRTLVQYDYRHTDGELFSCVKPTLDECRAARDKWLNGKGKERRRSDERSRLPNADSQVQRTYYGIGRYL